jgi:hypothetical protein
MLNRWSEYEILPWEQQAPEETDTAYRAFAVYRDLGPSRSLRRSAEVYYVERTSLPASQLRQLAKWSVPNRWVARSHEFDAWNDYERHAARENDIRAMETRHASIGISLQRTALERMETLTASQLTAPAVVQFLKEGVLIERLARGEATDRTELGGTSGKPVEIAAVSASQMVRDRLETMARNRSEVAELTAGISHDEP